MKKIYLALLFFVPAHIYGQETIKLTKIHRNPNYTEMYSVLKSNKRIVQGSYKKLSKSNVVLVDGFYKNGTKDSIWTEYLWNGKKIKTGKYLADKKVGLWEFYNFEGKLEHRFDFATNQLVFNEIDDKEKYNNYTIINHTGKNKIRLDRPPLFIDGSLTISNIISSYLRYPIKAQEFGISGKVEITFTIDSVGKTSNHRVTKGIGSGCDEEALRVVKMIPDDWLPGIYKGQPVSVEYVMPVFYKIQ